MENLTPADRRLEKGSRRSSKAGSLFEELEERGIPHCHWKSNIRIDETLSGKEDIDLLVRPANVHEFHRTINDCGFKIAVSHFGAGHPGVFHALALDGETGELVDLHAYHQIISGDSFVKSYRFPIEEQIVARASWLNGVRVVDPSSELVLFLVRMLLKHVSVFELIKLSRNYSEVRRELAWLLERSVAGQPEALMRQWFPRVGMPIDRMANCLTRGSLMSRIAMGMRMAWALRHERRLGHTAALFSRFLRVTKHYGARIRGRRNLSLLSGGSWIALVGPKGSGKSTLTALVAQRLGKKLDVKTIHMGKPPPSWISILPRLLVPTVRKAFPKERLSEYEKPERRAKRTYSLLFVFGKLMVAIDRQRLVIRAMRSMASGTLIISDRCPATNSTGLDGSAFDDLAVAMAQSSLQRWLMQLERSIYRQMPRPRIVLKLGAPLEVALQRDHVRCKRGGPDPVAVQRRWKLESEAEYDGSLVHHIDAAGSVDDTLRATLACIWDSV